MVKVFENTSINGLNIKNRIVRSATWEGAATKDGRPTEKTAKYYAELAKGDVGLIITGYTFVRPEGKQQPGKVGIHTDDFESDFKNITSKVHGAGGKVVVQLVHAGGQANSENSGLDAVAPSSITTKQFPQLPKELTSDDISNIIKAFAQGALRAKNWGFDGVQLHGAHGYLINQFLSPLTNQRKDNYGGSLENRSRFLVEVYQAIREKVGADYPVMIKINADDNLEGGFRFEDALQVCTKLDKIGIDAIEVSSGTSASGDKIPARSKINSPEKEAYNLNFTTQIKANVKCPVMCVGGFRSIEIIEKAIIDEKTDYVAMSRPFIREPNLVARWQNGNSEPSKCISCSRCFLPGMKGGIYCMPAKRLADKKRA